MQDVVYQPLPFVPNWKGPALLVLPVMLLGGLLIAEDNASRLIFLCFVGVFVVLGIFASRFLAPHFSHPLKLDSTGIRWAPFAERYGVQFIPWQEIERLDMFHGSGSSAGQLFWLRLYIRDGVFLRKLKQPTSEKLFGGNINVPLAFQAEPEEIVEMTRKFHRHVCS